MKQKFLFASFLVALLFWAAACKDSGGGGGGGGGESYPPELDRLVPGSSIVLKGKVLVTNSTLTDEEDVSRHGVVEVTEVIESPADIPVIKGEQITVRFQDIKNVKEGEERLFFAEPYWLGEFIGVDELGSVKAEDKLYNNTKLSSNIQQARTKMEETDLAKILKASPLVVAGKVNQTRRIPSEGEKLTEHDPEWMEAEIQVEEALHGKADGQIVKIVFASSRDVMFIDAPKLQQGDEGIFVLENTDEKSLIRQGIKLAVIDSKGFVRGKDRVAQFKRLLK